MITGESGGLIVYDMLSNNEDVKKAARKVFPVVTDNALLPYAAYKVDVSAGKRMSSGKVLDNATIVIGCFGSTYDEACKLAEAVRNALDNKKGMADGLSMYSCSFNSSFDSWADDAYIKTITFNAKFETL